MTSKNASRNDPMCEDFDWEDVDWEKIHLVECRPSKFAITCEGYFTLVDHEYDRRCYRARNFRQSVFKSMYRYAMMIHLYGRLAFLRQNKGISEYDDDKLAEYLRSKNFKIPESISLYLKNIGSFRDDNTAKNYVLELPVWPTSGGDFGRVSADTHWMYMSMPAPRVVTMAIMQDLAYTLDANIDPDWDLPEDLRPNSEASNSAGKPTANLLGWKRSTSLTSEHCIALDNSNVLADKFVAIGRFCLNRELFEYINDHLIESSEHAKLVDGALFECENGSIAQITFIQRDTLRTPEKFSRVQQYTETEIRLVSITKLDLKIAKMAFIFTYRVEKLGIGCGEDLHHTWCVYDWDEYKHVPKAWLDSRNKIFDHEIRINDAVFLTSFQGKDRARTYLIDKTNF